MVRTTLAVSESLAMSMSSRHDDDVAECEGMTEAEWMACHKSEPMLEFLRDKASDRKLRLFASACVRQKWSLLSDSLRAGVEVAESYADIKATEGDLRQAHNSAWGKAPSMGLHPACWVTCSESRPMLLAARVTKSAIRCLLLRDVFGNPFRPVTLDPAWRTPTVAALATAAYDERILPSGHLDANRLAVLADALEDVGCDNADILNHCRQGGEHVRGCWVVDLLLGKE
jgi:hypothetical protein